MIFNLVLKKKIILFNGTIILQIKKIFGFWILLSKCSKTNQIEKNGFTIKKKYFELKLLEKK